MFPPEVAGVTWRKSRRSNGAANCVEVATVLDWRKSSRSNGAGDCVEVAALDPVVAVRDSKSPHGGHFAVHARRWARFAAALKQVQR